MSQSVGHVRGHATDGDRAGGRRRAGPVAARVTTVAAALLVLAAAVAPSQLGQLTPAAFLRIPAELLLAVALVLVLPAGRVRTAAAVLVGLLLGVFAIWTVLDLGFSAVLARPFDPVFDWSLLGPGADFLAESSGQARATGLVIAAGLLAVAVLVLMPLAVLRLTRPVLRHRRPAAGAAAALGAGWVICAVLGVQIVPGVPVAAHHYDRVQQLATSLQDQQEFAELAAVDAFRDAPGGELLTGLRGKDVVIAFVESYGRYAFADPDQTGQVQTALAAGDRRLRQAGFATRSGFLASPTVGGASWLAHATLLSGLWVDNQQRYRTLVGSDRLTLNRAFQRAGWQTVAAMPAIREAWPEGEFFGYDRIYAAAELDYQGPPMNWGYIPDQYTMSVLERRERARTGGPPVMATVSLISSHAPWTTLPRLVGWDGIRDGSGFRPAAATGPTADELLSDPARATGAYQDAVGYTLDTLISYVETYGDDDLVLVLLGDHQPATVFTGSGAGPDVPVTIVAGDPAVLSRISGWGWQPGLQPGPEAPVWPMDAFRDRFLTAFS